MAGWNFPLNNGGQISGFNDPGIETFRGKPFESLAREIIQNSCDAKLEGTEEPVEVHFELHNIDSNLLPGREELTAVFESCKRYWHDNENAAEFFENGRKLLNSPRIPVLKISDYNTSGLTESKEKRGKWNALIKSVGVSNKDSESGGSFGIGKHAPFACSRLRTIFYGTKDKENCKAFQGVAKLATHNDTNDRETQGTGYFGITEGNLPIHDFDSVDSIFRREVTGTDLFIAGFNSAKNWHADIIRSVLDNFFVAILQHRLIVKVQDVRIDASTLPTLLEEYIDAKKKYFAFNYYEVLTSSDSVHIKKDFNDMGELELYLLKRKDLHKKVAMVRSTGMKIFDKDRFTAHFAFAGVLLTNGRELNKFLRSLEPPAHDKWEHSRHKEKTKAQKQLREIYDWIKGQIRALTANEESIKLEVGGMSQFLPDDLDNNPLVNQDPQGEGVKKYAREFEFKPVMRKLISKSDVAGAEVAAARDGKTGTDTGNEGKNETKDSKEEEKKDTRDDQERRQTLDPPITAGNDSPKRKTGAQRISSVRSFCADPLQGAYNITYLPETSGQSYLVINIVGEDGGEAAMIASAIVKETGEVLAVSSEGKIGPVQNVKGQKNTLLVVLQEAIRCSLEVTFK